MSNKISIFFCPKCGWFHEAALMSPECPDCFSRLDILTGTQEEIDKKIEAFKEDENNEK